MERILPKGWLKKPFTEILDIQGGTQPPKEVFISEERVGYIRLLQIRDFGEKPVPTYIPNEANLKTCSIDDILIARYGASIGRIVTGHAGAYNVALAKVIIPELINRRFIFWLLKSPLFQISITSFQRTAQNGFNKEDLSGLEIPLPPLPEQQRIVAKLDTLFGHLDALKTRLDHIPQLLKDFRQKVLTQAVTGKLTEVWREGKELEEWKMKTLGEFVIKIQAGKNFNCPEYPVTEDTVGLVKISAVTWGKFNPNETKTVLDESKIFPELFIKKGDFLMSRANTLELVGASLIVDEIKFRIMLSDKIWRVTFKEEIDKKYVDFFLKSSIGRNEIESRATGNQLSMRNISHDSFKKIDFNYPPIEEQQEIVRSVESLFAKADQIEASYKKLKAKIEALPQSMLAKAFRGELVEQLPTDGDARDLLEQIKRAKEGLEKGGKGQEDEGGG